MTAADVLVLVAAPAVGSFAGLLVERLPAGRPVVRSRSACDACGARLAAWELVPVLSWLAQRGRCRHCGAAVSAFHPTIELAALGIAVAVAATASGAALVFGCVLGWALLVLAILDARHFWLPDAVTLPLLAAGLGAAGWLDPAGWWAHAVGAVVGWGSFAAIAWAYRRLRGRDGLGGGDATLLGVAGAWLGVAALPMVVFAAAAGGLSQAVVTRRGRIAFGVWLAVAIWLFWVFGVPELG